MKSYKERELLLCMTRLYCRKKHKTNRGALCAECAEVLAYAGMKTDACPHRRNGGQKPFCRVH